MSDKGVCANCGSETLVKKNGDLWKHAKPDGGPCPSVTPGERLSVRKQTLLEKGYTESQQDQGNSDEEPVSEVPSNRYTHSVRVKRPCHFYEDSKWHENNKEVTWLQAEKAGYTPVGRVDLVGTDEYEDRVVFSYRVRV